jgi:hypothetical protein
MEIQLAKATATATATATTGGQYNQALGQQQQRPRGRHGILKWDSYFNLLVDYKAKHGNLVIPRNYTTTTTTSDNVAEEEEAGSGSSSSSSAGGS